MCIIDCLSTIVFILPLHLDYTKVIILILWWRNFQLEYWRTFQLVSTCYVVFNRKEQTFEMYQKFDSMYARYITGSFSIKNDPYLGAVISGEYDFGNGEWNNKYIVTDLLESGSMIWTAKDNENDVNKYIRCEKVPENIIAEAKVDKGE